MSVDLRETIVTIRLKPLAPGTWPCPNCSGTGTMADGWCSISSTEIKTKACSTCSICKGSGRVYIKAAPRFSE
jgi:hypothetical protein